MIETHPLKPFVPNNSKYLLVGSFVSNNIKTNVDYDWYYCSKRNQFWQIIELVYEVKLPTTELKQKLFQDLKLAVTDIIYQCERRDGNSLDNNLINIVFNIGVINSILEKNKIEIIYFSSRYVEKLFKKVFKNFEQNYENIDLITLPSPSPRYAKLNLKQKIEKYREALPKLYE